MLSLERSGPCRLPTPEGKFLLYCYRDAASGAEHAALVFGDIEGQSGVLVRVHSECLTGEVLHSLRCDCNAQLQAAMHEIALEGSGVILYLRQEGRGIGLFHKVRAYALQDAGADTVDANIELGFRPDEREYTCARHMLESLGVRSIELLTNNPQKSRGLRTARIQIDRTRPIETPVTNENASYLGTKRSRMGHLFAGSAV